MADWTENEVSDQTGRVVLITGANSGIGLEAARVLAERGAHVVLACRDPRKAEAARAELEKAAPGGIEVLALDLADLASVRSAADSFNAKHDRLDLLINNAGIMAVPYGTTADGFERQLGTNHLGHFALTGLVLERLLATPGSRVVTVSSGAHRWGQFDFDDLQWTRKYSRFRAYGRSKLANLLFTNELQRKLAAGGSKILALSAHPGMSSTNLGRAQENAAPGPFDSVLRLLTRPFMQSAAMGALPTLRAAVDPEAKGGEFYGPPGSAQMRGYPVRVEGAAAAADVELARRLWEVSEELTGVSYGPTI